MTNLKFVVLATSFLAFSCAPLIAQYQTEQQIGFEGLKAGSQPGPGIYITVPLYWRAGDLFIADAQGNQVLNGVVGAVNLFMLPSLIVTTPLKILGANFGFSFSQWIVNGVLDVAALNLRRTTSYGYGDIYVQPAVLGWHTPHADVTAAYAFFAPTGGNHGLNMWINEIDFGTTLYLDNGKKWNVSTMMYYDINQKKNNTDVKVGDVLTLMGGAGRSFLKGAANVGAAYGAQWKMTADSGTGIPALLPITNGRVFGVGPEIDTPVFAKGKNLGLMSFRYLWLVGAKTNFGGQSLTATFTFARLIEE